MIFKPPEFIWVAFLYLPFKIQSMKWTLVIASLFFFTSLFGQHEISWGPEIHVSDGDIYGNLRPRAALVQDSIPIVIYGKSGYGNLAISRWNGIDFDTDKSIIPNDLSSYIANWTGPDIAAKGDTVIATFKIMPYETGNVYSVRSTDGGLTFSDTIRVNHHEAGVRWMPSMEIEENGNPVITYMMHDANWTNPRYVIANSNDAGLTYEIEREIVTNIPGEACDCCPAEFIISGQKQTLLFRNNDNNVRDIHAVYSSDGGTTFPDQINVDNLSWTLNACPSTGSDAIFTDDALITAYASAQSGAYRVYVSSSSTNGGLSFGSRQQTAVTPTIGTQNFPRITGRNDTIIMTWKENDGANSTDIFYSLSINSADPISSLTGRKHKANNTLTIGQNDPDIIYSNGFVHLFFQDLLSHDIIYRRGVIQSTAGNENHDNSGILNIYPNPSEKGQYHLPNDVQIQNIKDVTGKEISYQIQTNNSQSIIDIDHSVKGIYFLNYLNNEGVRKTHKLMVK